MDGRRHAGAAGEEQLAHVLPGTAHHSCHVGEADDVWGDFDQPGLRKRASRTSWMAVKIAAWADSELRANSKAMRLARSISTSAVIGPQSRRGARPCRRKRCRSTGARSAM